MECCCLTKVRQATSVVLVDDGGIIYVNVDADGAVGEVGEVGVTNLRLPARR